MNASFTDIVPSNPSASGIVVALILSAGILALLAVATLAVVLQRQQRLTTSRGIASVATAVGVTLLALVGILLLAPAAAQASTQGAAHSTIHLAPAGSEV